jgi:hypothetical protein
MIPVLAASGGASNLDSGGEAAAGPLGPATPGLG